jgi:hypothetical protein
MARKMGLPYGDSDEHVSKPQEGQHNEPIVIKAQSNPKSNVFEVVDSDACSAATVNAATNGKVSSSGDPQAWFACPSCKRRYPNGVWQRRFTCQDATCLMIWSPLAPLEIE